MKLPVIKHIHNFIEENDEDFIHETVQVLEHITESSVIKDEELDVIGELLSNLYGAIEVQEAIVNGTPKKQAMNEFMQRVMGSIDK